MKVKADTIEELFSASGEQETDMRALDKLIVKTAPKLKRQLFSGPSVTMVGYGEMTWRNKSSSGMWPLISVAPQKGNISIYVAAENDGVPLAAIYRNDWEEQTTERTASASSDWRTYPWMSYAIRFWMPSNGARSRKQSMAGIVPRL